MGRKRTHHDATRTKIISARLTQQTYDLISEHAEKLGLTRAGYVEYLIEDRPLRIVRPISDELPITFLNELKRIGNNLNQIAHARNAGQNVDPRQFRTVVTEIVATICSNEVLRRRYETAEAEVASRDGISNTEELQLRKDPAARTPLTPDARKTTRPGETTGTQTHRPEPPRAAQQPATQTGMENQPRNPSPPPVAAHEWRLTERDFDLRLWPPERAQRHSTRKPTRHDTTGRLITPAKTHDPKTSSSWFKLPWRK